MDTKTIINSIDKLLVKNNDNIVNNLLLFLETKMVVSEDLRTYITEFKSTSKTNKKKRELSVFNLFVKDISLEIKNNNQNIPSKEVLKEASALWKNSERGVFIKEFTDSLIKSDKTVKKDEAYRKSLEAWAEKSSS
jgi:HMG-box domain